MQLNVGALSEEPQPDALEMCLLKVFLLELLAGESINHDNTCLCSQIYEKDSSLCFWNTY